MSEQRFTFYEYDDCTVVIEDTENDESYSVVEVCGLLNEQQATIQSLQDQLTDYNEIKDNWDSMVEMSVKISKRNIELVEENARLRKELEE